jgi:DNA-binding GntR family transcriptional regulator
MPGPDDEPRLGQLHSPLAQLVADKLRERILGGELGSGERLVESRLSEEMGVSRVPVREALRKLASEGLVSIEPRRGATVISYSEEQVRELVEVRATLEALNAKLAAKRHDESKVAELKAILEEGVKAADSGDAADSLRLVVLNDRFHDALGNIAANAVLSDMMRSLRERTALLFAPMNRSRGRQNWEEHSAILRAVISKDAEMASFLAARHVYSAANLQAWD